MSQPHPQKKPFVFHIERTFDAPRDRMWKAWEDPEQFKKWMGPKGSVMTACDMDFRSGGNVRYSLEFESMSVTGQWAFLEITPPKEIVALVSFIDKSGKIIEHPGMPGWPLEILSTVTFTEENGKTKIAVAWSAYEASDVEIKTFEDNAPSMNEGWTGTFERLENFLSQE